MKSFIRFMSGMGTAAMLIAFAAIQPRTDIPAPSTIMADAVHAIAPVSPEELSVTSFISLCGSN